MSNIEIREVVAEVVDTPKKSQKVPGYKPAPGTLVTLDYELGHYPFFVFGKSSENKRVRKFPGGRWEIESPEFPHFGDLDVLLGILKLAENARRKGVKPVVTFEAGIADERATFPVETSVRKLLKYCNRKKGGNAVSAVKAAVHRLSLLQATRYTNKGGVRSIRILNSYDFGDEDRTDARFELNNSFLEYCNIINKMQVFYRELQLLKTQLEKGLFLFLSLNKKPYVSETKLLRFFGIARPAALPQYPSKAQREIFEINRLSYLNRKRKVTSELVKETIPSLVRIGFLEGFDEETQYKICESRGRKFKYFLLFKNRIFGHIPILPGESDEYDSEDNF